MKMRLLAMIAVALLATACTNSAPPPAAGAAPAETKAEATAAAEAQASAPEATNPPGAPLPPPPMDAGATGDGEDGAAAPPPSIAVGEPNPGAPGVVDASCRTDADCAIKDVGSCCGYRPQCVNTASPTFPERVQAECASSGRMGICGFPAITGCKCTAGKCEGTGASVGEQVR